MNVKICDKCGDKINTNPMTNSILPMFSISRWVRDSLVTEWKSIDLCPKCEKVLAEWLDDHSTEGCIEDAGERR